MEWTRPTKRVAIVALRTRRVGGGRVRGRSIVQAGNGLRGWGRREWFRRHQRHLVIDRLPLATASHGPGRGSPGAQQQASGGRTASGRRKHQQCRRAENGFRRSFRRHAHSPELALEITTFDSQHTRDVPQPVPVYDWQDVRKCLSVKYGDGGIGDHEWTVISRERFTAIRAWSAQSIDEPYHPHPMAHGRDAVRAVSDVEEDSGQGEVDDEAGAVDEAADERGGHHRGIHLQLAEDDR